MAEQEQGITIRGFTRMLRRRWWLIAACALVAGAVATVYSASQPKAYQGTASLLFRDAGLDQTLFGSTYFAAQDPAREAATNTKLVSLGVVSQRTARALGNRVTGAQVQSEVTVEAAGQSNVVSITATDANP